MSARVVCCLKKTFRIWGSGEAVMEIDFTDNRPLVTGGIRDMTIGRCVGTNSMMRC